MTRVVTYRIHNGSVDYRSGPMIVSTFLALLFTVFCLPTLAGAQFLDLQLKVEPELTATTERPLDFGIQAPNSGRVTIPLGAVNMGIFSIRALEHQNLLVTLSLPEELPHDNPAVEQAIPLDLHARYGYAAQNPENSTPLDVSGQPMTVAPTAGPGPWSILYIFVYGSIEIGAVPDGNYGDEILLSVEYF